MNKSSHILKNKFFPMFSFSAYKIIFLLPTLIIEILSLIGLITSMIIVFLKFDTANEFLKNFQYIILFFINLFLLLFIVLSTVRIFADEIADGTFLLLISKPYTRFKIFFCKFIALFFLILVFLIINFGLTILTGTILNIIEPKPEVFKQILKTFLWLGIYAMFFSFVVLSGAIFISLAFSAQVVLLILTVLSSMFLLGGLPYSLISKIQESQNLRWGNTIQEVMTVAKFKNPLLFSHYIKHEKVRYPKLTKAIYEFYSENDKTGTNESQDFYNKKRDFYRSINLVKLEEEQPNYSVKFRKAYSNNKNAAVNIPEGSEGIIYYKLKNIFFNVKDLEQLLETNNNEIIKETLELTEVYELNQKRFSFFLNRKDKLNSQRFLSFDDKEGNDVVYFVSETNKISLNDFAGNDYREDGDWKVNLEDQDGNDINWEVREPLTNIVFLVINALDYQIQQIMKRINEIGTRPILDDNSFHNYNNLQGVYRILSYINVFEHWNQLWTSLIGFPNLELDLNFLIEINWDDKYRNYLNSYEDFPLQFKENNSVDTEKIQFFLNYQFIFIGYGSLAIILFLLSLIIIKRKDIT